jgi:hypothetical protein
MHNNCYLPDPGGYLIKSARRPGPEGGNPPLAAGSAALGIASCRAIAPPML